MRCGQRRRATQISFESPANRIYDEFMTGDTKPRRCVALAWRAVVETAFIVFLFYSNLLMGEFTVSGGKGKSLAFALNDIFTETNFLIAIFSAIVGYVAFEFLRKKL